ECGGQCSPHAPPPLARGLPLSFYPGVRPIEPIAMSAVRAVPLFASSGQSYTRRLGARPGRSTAGPRSLAVAADGTLEGGAHPFRLVVVGDVDFASNSFFPYMSHSELTLAILAWLLREERTPTVRPPFEVLPRVTLTDAQVRWIFLTTAVAQPGGVAVVGLIVWWRRRRYRVWC